MKKKALICIIGRNQFTLLNKSNQEEKGDYAENISFMLMLFFFLCRRDNGRR
jgi:hypothetical protein